ncbi:hypothetical protein BKG92_06705 [Rodentibacter ratti]|uniref:Lysine exporter LysO family protein n=2 Tax=Rodentibacter ratti TaxID=1906745 RepID=A0A1V3KXB5_9PAST|nr:hypothetical protein BKG92_06705 [Rodentibacter ratti]
MINGLLIVLVPMLLGYLLKVKNKKQIAKINQIVMFLLYIILFLMGYLLGQLDDLEIKLPIIAKTATVLSVIILTSNMLGLMIYDRLNPAPLLKSQEKITSRWHALIDSFKLSGTVVAGTLCGWLLKAYLILPTGINLYVLVVLIFFVGIQLRNNGISLKEALFNKRGFQTGMVFTVTSLFGGIVAALVLTMPITQGLAFASGMGWYSLSSVVLTNAWGPIQGSIAFFNDLSREIISLFIVPIFMQHFRSTAIGITGATALDCTLPIIQKSGGIEVTPIAISFGVVTNILPPLLLVFFSSIPV